MFVISRGENKRRVSDIFGEIQICNIKYISNEGPLLAISTTNNDTSKILINFEIFIRSQNPSLNILGQLVPKGCIVEKSLWIADYKKWLKHWCQKCFIKNTSEQMFKYGSISTLSSMCLTSLLYKIINTEIKIKLWYLFSDSSVKLMKCK